MISARDEADADIVGDDEVAGMELHAADHATCR